MAMCRLAKPWPRLARRRFDSFILLSCGCSSAEIRAPVFEAGRRRFDSSHPYHATAAELDRQQVF